MLGPVQHRDARHGGGDRNELELAGRTRRSHPASLPGPGVRRKSLGYDPRLGLGPREHARRSDAAAPQVDARPRRAARAGGGGCGRLPPPPRRAARRVPRRRPVLRPVRLPHHVAARPRARRATRRTGPRPRRPRRLLGAAGPPPPARRCSSRSSGSPSRHGAGCRAGSSTTSGPTGSRRSPTSRTGTTPGGTSPTSTPPRRRARSPTSGRSRSRSRSTCCGRWRLLVLYRLTRGRRAPLAAAVGLLVVASATAMVLTDRPRGRLPRDPHARAGPPPRRAARRRHAAQPARDASAVARRGWSVAGDGRRSWVSRPWRSSCTARTRGCTGAASRVAAVLGVLAVAGAARGAGPLGLVTGLAAAARAGPHLLRHLPLPLAGDRVPQRGSHRPRRLDPRRRAPRRRRGAHDGVVQARGATRSATVAGAGWVERTAAPLAAGAAAALLVVTGLAATVGAHLPGGAERRTDLPRRRVGAGHDPVGRPDHRAVRPPSRTEATATSETVPRPPPRRIVIIGDSVANSLAPGVVAAGAARGIQVVDRTVSGCGLVTNSEPAYADGSRIEFTAACKGGIQEVQTSVPAEQPDLVLVLSTWEAGDRVAGRRAHAARLAGWDESLSAGLQEMLHRVRGRRRDRHVPRRGTAGARRGPHHRHRRPGRHGVAGADPRGGRVRRPAAGRARPGGVRGAMPTTARSRWTASASGPTTVRTSAPRARRRSAARCSTRCWTAGRGPEGGARRSSARSRRCAARWGCRSRSRPAGGRPCSRAWPR